MVGVAVYSAHEQGNLYKACVNIVHKYNMKSNSASHGRLDKGSKSKKHEATEVSKPNVSSSYSQLFLMSFYHW